MKRTRWGIFFIVVMMMLLTGCGYAGPEKAVRRELNLIKKLDGSTIQDFITSTNLQRSNTTVKPLGEETTDALKLFFKNFSYRITTSTQNNDKTQALVTVDITNLDSGALAKDLCKALIRAANNSDRTPDRTDGLTSAFAVMQECLENNAYDKVKNTYTLQLKLIDKEWTLIQDENLQDALTGGLTGYLSDPYLLTPEEVLSIYLEPFDTFTAADWKDYLQLSDVFATGSELADSIDDALTEQVAANYQASIQDIRTEGDTANIDLAVTSLDIRSILTGCREQLLAYADTTESIRATDEELSALAAQYILDGLQNNQQSDTHVITVELFNNGFTWETQLDEDFTDAVLGGMNEALTVLDDTINQP